jgi:two-component system chemotaxis response regulator CheB
MIRVFIIDDNVMVRYGLTQLLSQEPDIAVIGDAPPNKDLAAEIDKTKPDILIFDIPIPRNTGIKYLSQIHKFYLPSIIFTGSDKNIASDLIPLLEAGAVGFVIKPENDRDLSQVRDQLLYEIRLNSKKIEQKRAIKTPTVSFLDPLWCVAIGSSTGGPEALLELVTQFPENFPAGIAIVQHMPAGFTTRFSARLNSQSHIVVKEAEQGDTLKAGMALVAPGDWHMEFVETRIGPRRIAKVNLTKDPPQWLLRPTVDHMMSSLAPIYGNRIVAAILTGMGEDGVVGTRFIKKHGGHTLVQNKASSVVFGMGQEVIKNNLADEVLPLNKIAGRIMEIIQS